ncbi:MAG: hypothetical protein ACXAC5_02170 [Promethearchaeota archaeon]|jgi:hypothetical protein
MTEAQAMNEIASRIGEVATGLEQVASSLEKLPGGRQIVLHDLSLIAAGFAQQEGMTPESAADKALRTYRSLLVIGANKGDALRSLIEKVAI